MLTWQCLPFSELSNEILYAVLRARQEVFIVEQNCPFLDADDVDQQCWHLVGRHSENSAGLVAAYARLVPPGIKFNEPSIGRVITTAVGRGQGFGRELMQRAIDKMQELYPNSPIRIGAQQYLEKFYGRFGFQTVSEPYIEDGIPHVEMLRQPGALRRHCIRSSKESEFT